MASTGSAQGNPPARRHAASLSCCLLPSTSLSSLRRAFTLTELLVVLAILAIVATLAVPAMGPMFASNQTASAISTMGSLLVTAQTTARAYGTPVGLRIEQAYKTDPRNPVYMVDSSGTAAFEQHYKDASDLHAFNPVRLNHQQVRLVAFAPGRSDGVVSQAFEVPAGSFDPVALPRDIWVAPGEYRGTSILDKNINPARFRDLVDDLLYAPYDKNDSSVGGVRYNRIENFLVIFNAAGELVRHPWDKCYFKDERQTYGFHPVTKAKYAPFVSTPEDSARSLILYERSKWNNFNPTDGAARQNFLQRTAVPIYINRFTGAVLEGKR